MRVNRAGLADVFGKTPPTIDAWLRDGCPIEKRGSRGVAAEFDTGKVAKWLHDRAVKDATGNEQQDEAEIDRRTKRAKMLVAELELAKARNEVAPVAEFEQVQAARSAIIRQNVMNVAQRAVLQLLGCTDETEFKLKLNRELKLALDTAANAAIELPEDEELTEDEG